MCYPFKISLAILLLFTASSFNICAQQTKAFKLKGMISGVENGMIYLGYYSEKEQKVINDSSIITNGSFCFTGEISNPVVAFIRSSRSRALGPENVEIFLEPAAMTILLQRDNFSELQMIGSETQKEYEVLRNDKNRLNKNYKDAFEQLSNSNFKGDRDSLEYSVQPFFDSSKKKDFEFFLSHPESMVTLYLLQFYTERVSLDTLTFFYSRLSAKLQQSIIGQRIFEKISKKGTVSVGSAAKPFVAVDINNSLVVSQLFKGKYVLLDFWASWCVPCRKSNPYLIQLHKRYKDKDFAIISISDDHDTTAWKNAVAKDNTGSWTHILNGKNPQLKYNGLPDPNDINRKFGVEVLPTMILLDKYGLIIARYTDSDEIEQVDRKLKEVLQ